MKDTTTYAKKAQRSIKSLGLDLAAAEAGKTWLLLPIGHRDNESGLTYPLPTFERELHKLAKLYYPKDALKRDAGCRYLRRASKEWNKRQKKKLSAENDMEKRRTQIAARQYEYNRHVKSMLAQSRMEMKQVRAEIQKEVANLRTLFDLVREGMDGLLKAYVKNEDYHGHTVKNSEFLAASRIITSTVSRMGMPDEQKLHAQDAITEQIAEHLKNTQAAVAMAPGSDEDTEN